MAGSPASPTRRSALALFAASAALWSCGGGGHSASSSPSPASTPASTAAQAELDRQVELRATDIAVQPGTIGHLMPMDSPQNDADTFVFTGTNRSTRTISALTAEVELDDAHGATLYRGRLQTAGAVAPSGSFVLRVTVSNDAEGVPNPELVRGASVSDARLRYHIVEITYP